MQALSERLSQLFDATEKVSDALLFPESWQPQGGLATFVATVAAPGLFETQQAGSCPKEVPAAALQLQCINRQLIMQTRDQSTPSFEGPADLDPHYKPFKGRVFINHRSGSART